MIMIIRSDAVPKTLVWVSMRLEDSKHILVMALGLLFKQ